MEINSPANPIRPRVGLLYDERMCEHSKPPEDNEHHPEIPNRIKAIWSRLESANIPQRCLIMKAKEAEDKYIGLVHQQKYIDLIKNYSSKTDSQRKIIAEDFNSIYLNEGSSQSAYLAAGGVIEVAEKVSKGELDSAVAIVRPPGHHAEADEAFGFCIFNNVAIAASVLVNEKPELGIKKILIVDWDVHHGNGTQNMFWEDSRVLVFNIHRGCFVTPNGYSVMLKKLLAFASGRIVMALEVGYHVKSLSKSVLACVEALLEDRPIIGSSKSDASPLESTWHVIETVRKELSKYWPMLSGELPNTTKRISLVEELQSANRFTTDTHATLPSVKVCNSITVSTCQALPYRELISFTEIKTLDGGQVWKYSKTSKNGATDSKTCKTRTGMCEEYDTPDNVMNSQLSKKCMDGSEDVESSRGDRAWQILSQRLRDSENSVKALKEDLKKEQEKVKRLENSNFDLKTKKEISLKEVESLKKESTIYIEQAKRLKRQICSQDHVINQNSDKMMQLNENNKAQQQLPSFICSALEMRITAEQQRCNILENKLLFADKQVASDTPATTPAGNVYTYISTPQAILLEKQFHLATVEVLVPEMTPEDDGPEKKRCKTSNYESLITTLLEDLKREQEQVINLEKSVTAESSLKDLALKEVESLKVEPGNYIKDVVNLKNEIFELKGVINQTEAEVSKLKIEILDSQKEQKLVSSLKMQNLSEQKKCKELEQKCTLAEEIFDEYQSDCMRFQSRMESVFRKDETIEKERKVKKVPKGEN
ncbi:hypothetical protein MKX01_008546 [Papaver californicum]|nr:hypothetical protein MKX01_008546 [Papaver californicum]